jgi:hypothetical protein
MQPVQKTLTRAACFACAVLAANANPWFVAQQLGHVDVQSERRQAPI